MSLRKKVDQIKAEEEQQEKLQERLVAEEEERQRHLEEERIAKENTFFEEHKDRIITLFHEINIFGLLEDIRDEFWRLGVIGVGGGEVRYRYWNGLDEYFIRECIEKLKEDGTTAICEVMLEARWDALVEDESSPKHSYIFEECRSLVVTATVYKSGAYIQVNDYDRIKYHGTWDIEKISYDLAWDCNYREETDNLPYSKQKEEEEKKIRNFKFWHPFIHLERRKK